jgi:hypothetical protein
MGVFSAGGPVVQVGGGGVGEGSSATDVGVLGSRLSPIKLNVIITMSSVNGSHLFISRSSPYQTVSMFRHRRYGVCRDRLLSHNAVMPPPSASMIKLAMAIGHQKIVERPSNVPSDGVGKGEMLGSALG